MKRTALVLLAALVVTLPALADSSARADETIVVTPHDTRTRLAKKEYDGIEFTLIVTGTFTIEYASGQSAVYDALYCFKGCGSKRENRSPLDMLVPGNNPIPSTYGGLWNWSAIGDPAYNAAHRYELGPFNTAHTKLFDGLQFEIARTYRDCRDCRFSGSFTIRIVPGKGDVEEPVEPLRVNFIVSVSGKPNLPLKGYPGARTLTTSRVSGSGHATFTKKNASVLIATETKGSVVHEDTYADGTKHTLTFGIVSGTRYYPGLRRIALVLKLKDSNDPACKTGFLISTTFGVLTLLPHEDVGPDGGTVIFFGLPKSKLTDPCRHAHGWVTSPRERVRARLLIAESKP